MTTTMDEKVEALDTLQEAGRKAAEDVYGSMTLTHDQAVKELRGMAAVAEAALRAGDAALFAFTVGGMCYVGEHFAVTPAEVFDPEHV